MGRSLSHAATSSDKMQREACALQSRIEILERELTVYKTENERLLARVTFFERHPCLAAGIKGETIIAELLSRARTTGNASYDIEGSVHLEVKYSRLTTNSNRYPVKRWTWGTVFGMGGNKVYDQLILLGDKDPAFNHSYKDPSCPYVLFDVPYANVCDLITDGGTARDLIRLSSNPSRVSSRSRMLFSEFQVTQAVLESRYGVYTRRAAK